MVVSQKFIILTLAVSLLAGCTGVKRLTGQIDNTTLPGQREDILPPDQQQARDPAITGQPLPPVPAQPATPAQGASVTPGKTAALPQVKPPAATTPGQESITDTNAKPGADCDPKVDLCPQPLQPDPLPPPSPVAKDTTKKTAKVIKKKTTKPAVVKKAATPAAPAPDQPPAPDGKVLVPPAPPAPQAQ